MTLYRTLLLSYALHVLVIFHAHHQEPLNCTHNIWGRQNSVCPAVAVGESELVAGYKGCIDTPDVVSAVDRLLMMGMGYARNM
jgi:hypothetical protein